MKRVVVGLSGGVDSSVAAYLLKEQGYDVVGLFMRNWHDTTGTLEGDCPWYDDQMFAELTAKRLDIPFHFIDLSDEYRRRVVDYMFAEYGRGRTPNPDVLCNREIKFDVFLREALKLGADYVATGHYCRKAEETLPDGRTIHKLLAGSDPNKDQSYFLSLVPAARLQRALFPLADQDKAQSVALVAGAGLRVPLPRESQDICFVPDDEVAYRPFLAAQWRAQGMEPPGAGPVLLAERPEDGAGETREIGRHQGLWRYTEGQRKGLGIAHSEPLYVLRKDRVANALIVGPRSLLGMTACVTGAANILVPPEDWPEQVSARLRHRQRAAPARARLDARDRLHITLAAPQFPSAPGQVAALYDADGRVLAGGVVERLE